MEIRQNPAFGPASPPLNVTPTSASATQISSDFEVFLKMLTAQMQFQDPLNPVDSTDYATQLATFSGVEQAVLTNDLLKSLTTQMGIGGLTDMASWVGKEARSSAPAYFDGTPISLFPKSVVFAEKSEIVVTNARGEEVERLPFAPGTSDVVWNGTDANGLPFTASLYQFEVVGTTGGEVIGRSEIDVYSRITEVRLDTAGQTLLVLAGGATVPSADVTALREGDR